MVTYIQFIIYTSDMYTAFQLRIYRKHAVIKELLLFRYFDCKINYNKL